jgi:hypothetical protein
LGDIEDLRIFTGENDGLNIAPAAIGSMEMLWRFPREFLKIFCRARDLSARYFRREYAMIGLAAHVADGDTGYATRRVQAQWGCRAMGCIEVG